MKSTFYQIGICLIIKSDRCWESSGEYRTSLEEPQSGGASRSGLEQGGEGGGGEGWHRVYGGPVGGLKEGRLQGERQEPEASPSYPALLSCQSQFSPHSSQYLNTPASSDLFRF